MTTQLKDLLQNRKSKIDELKAIAENPAAGGDLSEAQNDRFLELRKSVEAIDARIERQRYLDEIDRRSAGANVAGDNLAEQFSKFSIRKAILSCIPGSNVDAGLEREVSQELGRRSRKQTAGFFVPSIVFQKRIMSKGTGAAGGYLVGTDHSSEAIDILRPKLITQQLGATVLSDLVGDLEIPRLGTGATAEWVNDNSAFSGTDQVIEQVGIAPKHVGNIVEYSRSLFLEATPTIEEFLRNDLSLKIAEAIDKAALTGNGTNEPQGIINHSTIPTVEMGENGAALTYAKVLDLLASIEGYNASATAWVMSPAVAAQLRQTKRDAQATDSRNVVLEPEAISFLGYPYVVTGLIPLRTKGTSTNKCSSLILGNWADLLIGYWGALEVLVNPFESTAFSKGNIQIRLIQSCDIAIRQPNSFARIIDAKVLS